MQPGATGHDDALAAELTQRIMRRQMESFGAAGGVGGCPGGWQGPGGDGRVVRWVVKWMGNDELIKFTGDELMVELMFSAHEDSGFMVSGLDG